MVGLWCNVENYGKKRIITSEKGKCSRVKKGSKSALKSSHPKSKTKNINPVAFPGDYSCITPTLRTFICCSVW